ncbi:hypothetical protein NT01EI_1460 [Edwardsiella ictaluri 93-146]|uniref:Uncharacterized protein n=1 Tax=Edwardsiella ictaluri (strain 93-146) TaxID=634503 RepID=C5BDU8_EDWI9|nr:hypothetical protein NT01EI_1460 [Edwardsiella ictaluri 93-146]
MRFNMGVSFLLHQMSEISARGDKTLWREGQSNYLFWPL